MIKLEYERFGLFNQDEMWSMTNSAELSTDLRMVMAALSRMNDEGHAVFEPGELRSILGKIDTRTGEKRPISRQAVADAKRKLYEAGFLQENSGGERCLWVRSHVAFRKKAGNQCPAHWKSRRAVKPSLTSSHYAEAA